MNDNTDTLDQRSAWWNAVKAKDYGTLQSLLDQGFDLESLSAQFTTGFLFCAGNGMLDQAQWFLDRGADPNVRDMSGANALHLAVRRGALSELETLEKMGVDINGQDDRGSTPLLLATTHEHKAFELASSLIGLGADPNIAAKSTSTPLLVAAASADMRVVDILLDAGANHLAIGARGNLLHSLLESKAKDCEDYVAQVIERFDDLDVNQLSRAGSTPLAFAVDRGARKALKALLQAGADPNARAVSKLGNRMSALMLLACGPADEETYKLAFAKGADPELRDERGFSALAYALASSMSEEEGKIIEEAIQGQQVDQKQVIEMAEDMLWARRQRNIEALIAGGASPTAPLTADGRSAYHTVMDFSNKEKRLAAIKWLGKQGFATTPGRASIQFPVPEDAWATNIGELALRAHRDEDTIQALMDAGLDPARPDEKSGNTLLHCLAQVQLSAQEQHAIQMAQRKILARSSDDEKDKEARESLQKQVEERVEAVEVWREEMFSRLCQVAGTPDTPDKRGLTPLSYFIANGVSRLSEAALAAGADPLRCDEDGDNAIHVAIKTGNVEWLHHLVEKVGPQSKALESLFLDMTYTSPEAGSRVPFVNAMRSLVEANGGVDHWLNAKDENGNTPLVIAAATTQEDLVDTFLVMGANPNVAASDGNTALHHAIMEDRGDIVKALLAMDADPELRNKAGKNATDLAFIRRTPYVIRAVQEANGEKPSYELPEELVKAAATGKEKAQRAVIAALPPRRMAM